MQIKQYNVYIYYSDTQMERLTCGCSMIHSDLKRPSASPTWASVYTVNGSWVFFLESSTLLLGLALLMHLSTSSWSCAVWSIYPLVLGLVQSWSTSSGLVLSSSAVQAQMSHALLFKLNFPAFCFLANQIYSNISIVLFPPSVFLFFFLFFLITLKLFYCK